MTWELQIPVRDLDAPIGAAAFDDCRAIQDPEQRAITQDVLLRARTVAGCQTMRDVVEVLEQASPEQRRQVIDRARARLGLPSTSRIDTQRHLAMTSEVAHRYRLDTEIAGEHARIGFDPTGAIVDLDELEQDATHARDEQERLAAIRAAQHAARAEEDAERQPKPLVIGDNIRPFIHA